MKRSGINKYIREAGEFLAGMRFSLPPFAYWSPGEWESKGKEYDEIRDNLLGWDITDFGRGDYDKFGLLLFTIRNGNVRVPSDKPYAEKILIVKPGQKNPNHFHKSKMEDIINRGGGGILKIRLCCSIDDRTPDLKSDVPISVDGRNFTVKAGTVVSLGAGESITLHKGGFSSFLVR
jgi:D-lyxose ketol-isomerase